MRAYRVDGQGRAAHDPAMMVALLLYAYAIGERSSRRIERRCVEDVATRVICANRAPDHTTIARFRQRHEDALAELFGEVLALCAESGLVRVGVIAVDGTKVARERVAARDARLRADRARDPRGGRRRRRRGGRALRRRARRRAARASSRRAQGRRGWLREAKRRLDERRAEEARPIPKSRPEAAARRPSAAWRRNTRSSCDANAAYEAYRARGVMKDGRGFGRPPDPF